MKIKIIFSSIIAALLTGCATNANAPQAGLPLAEATIITLTSSATVAALIYKPASRPAIQAIADGFTLLSSTNQLSIGDIAGQFTMLKLIGGTNNPIIALEMQNVQGIITAIGAQTQNMPTNQALIVLQGIAGANATGINRGLAVIP